MSGERIKYLSPCVLHKSLMPVVLWSPIELLTDGARTGGICPQDRPLQTRNIHQLERPVKVRRESGVAGANYTHVTPYSPLQMKCHYTAYLHIFT